MAENEFDDPILTECIKHYELSTQDLDPRCKEFDTADELFRSYIDPDTWPFQALIFSPRVFTAIFEKTSRLIGGKPRGRLVPREGGDVLGAKINNELLSYQWDDASRIDGEPLIAKWAQMDMNTRKYGASFAVAKWYHMRRLTKDSSEKKDPKFQSVPFFDGPGLQVINNRDVLYNPSYSVVKNWIQIREYLTYNELMATNDSARGAPIYENLDELRSKLKAELKTVDRRDNNYSPRGKSIKGMTDFLGSDETNRVMEIVTEYRDNRWITFAPKHKIKIRDIENPYKHQMIPIIMLKYYSIDDDLYGISEIEPIEKLQKGLNAITSQYVDAVNVDLYPPMMVDSTRVKMHTLEFGAQKKWIVTGDPRTAIAPYQSNTNSSIGAFRQTYSLFVGEIQEALGETSSSTGQQNQATGSDRTATEIRDLAQQQRARDNFNQIFLSEAIKKQMMFWHSMNQQFYFDEGDFSKILRLTDKDSIAFFQKRELDQYGVSDENMQQVAEAEMGGVPINSQEFEEPIYPAVTGMDEMGQEIIQPKMKADPFGGYAELQVEPQDLMGNYDYIADIESMEPPNSEQLIAAKREAIALAKDPAVLQMLQMEGKTVKLGELMEDYFEALGFKDAGKYFENVTNLAQPYGGQAIDLATGQVIGGGGAGAPAIAGNQGNPVMQGMGAPQGAPSQPAPQLMAGPSVR